MIYNLSGAQDRSHISTFFPLKGPGTIHEITCHLFIFTAPGAARRNWNEKCKSSSNITSAKRSNPTTPLLGHFIIIFVFCQQISSILFLQFLPIH